MRGVLRGVEVGPAEALPPAAPHTAPLPEPDHFIQVSIPEN